MKKKRVLAMLLAISLIIPNVYVRADNPDDGTPGDATVISSEEVTTEEEKTTEKEESKESSFTTPVEDVDTTLIDFSSRELLIGTEDPSIFTWDTEVVSEYNGIYLTRYENEEVTKNAYTYYYDKADFVDANVVFTVQDKEETEGEDLLQLNEGDDAISNLNDMDRSQELPTGTIAVIDTGSDGSDNVIEAVSVIGDTTSDDNGHGTKVIGAISSVYPEAKILSIKALGSDGKGDTASIYAAISYAIERKAGIINLSVSSLGIADSDVIKEVIDNAVAQGIIVVGAAGNNGKNAKYYVPGGIDSAIIVGSYDNDAEKNGNSNYGPTVDYYLKADSTSVASAKMSAVIAKDGISQIEESKENGFIYRPSPDDLKDETEIIEYMHNNSVYFEGADSIHAGVDAPSWYDAVKTYITDTLGMTIDIDYGYWSASSVTYNEVCATLVSRIINNSYPNEFHIEGSSSAPTLYNQLKSSTKWEEITNSDTWYYHNNLYTNGNWLTKIRPGDVIIWGDETNDPPTQSSTLPLSQVAATHAEIATYWGCAYNNGEGEDYDPYYGYRKWADWDYRNRNGVDGYTSAGQYFKVFRPVDAKDYYIAIKKIDARGYVMNGVSFTVSYHNNDTNSDVTIKGEYRDGKYYGIWTGFMNNEANQVPKNYLETANEGVGVFYLGKFSNTPTEIRVTENWSGRSDEGSAWAGGRAELVTQLKTETQAKKSHSVYSYEYAPNTSSKSLAAYNTEAEAISSAQVGATSQNPKYLYKNWHFAYATMVKKPDNETFAKNNPQYTFDGITYGLYGNSSCAELIATVKLTANGDKTEGYIKNLKDITINKTTTDNGSEPYRTTINGVHGIGGLMYGNYWWKEISTNNTGYKLDTTPHQITVSASHTEDYYKFTDTDSMEMGKIRVRKLLTGNGASGTSPAGATYRIWSTTFEWESTFTIGTDGYSPYKDLVYGTYKIQETGVPTAKPANGTWTIDSKIYTVVLKKGGGTDTVNSEVHVESENATVESTDKAVLNYYVAVKKVDNNGNPMNGITFDITINGTTHTKALKTGQYYDGSSYSTTNVPNGVAIYFVGSYETTPSVSVTENWTEKWSKNRYVHDTTTKSTAAGSLSIYNTKADAQSHAASFTYTNYGYGFATMHKDPAITTNLSLAGIQYQLRRCRNGNGVTVDQLVATVTLNASGKISDVTLSDMNCWTETLNGETCIGGLTYGNQSGTNNYYWVESQSNANYYPNTTKYYITVNKSNAIKPGTDASKYPLDAYTFTPASATGTDSPRTYLYLTKASSNPDCTDGNPNYSLEGATYKLYKSRAEAETALTSKNYGTALATFNVKANGTSVVNGTTTVNLDVSQWMNQNPLTGLFLNTTFYLVESAAGKNYLRSTEIASVQVTPANTSANPAHAEMTDKPVNDPFSIELIKTDRITGSNVLPKDKTLEGAKFKVDFYAANIETVLANANGNVASYLKSNYSPVADYSSEVTIAKNNAGQYYALINNDGTEYPLGFLVITEIQPPTDYKLEGAEQYIRKGITKTKVTGNLAFVTYRQFDNDQTTYEEKTYYPNNATTLAELTSSSGTRHGINVSVEGWNIKVDNQPIRGDVRLTKVTYADGTPLESVEFVIKNLDTGEEHSIFTDAQGNATTVGNEDAWFSKSTDDNDPIPYTAGYGALPAGNYTITEKRSEANEKYQLLASEPFTIDSESTILIAASDNKLYNIEMPYLTTTAMDEATQSKSLAQGETATIIDTIKYYHLRANSKFFIVGTLMVRHQDGTYEPYMKDGEPYTVTSEAINTPATWTKSEFEIDGEYVMEFPDVDPASYEGCSFVVFQKLYYDSVPNKDSNAKQYKEYAGTTEKIFPVLHEDIDEEGQTVRPVDIHTNATDGITDDHISKPEGTVTIVDRVSYTGLTVGEEYTITGTLHVTGYTWKDAEGNEIKTVDADDTLLDEEGQPVTAETTFTAESTDGYIDLEFTIDASLLAGESVVAFEELIYKDKTIALHADIDDEDQTVHFGNLHTTLYRGGTEEWAEDFDEDDITKVTTVDESSKEVMAAEDAVVVDRIKYHNLLANRHYVIKGILMDKETKEPFVDADGNTVEVTYEFDTPEVEAVEDTDSPNSVKYICADGTELDMSADYADYLVDGYADVEFPAFNGTGMDGKTLVAYEEVYIVYTDETTGEEEEALVAEHKDIDDVDQTVRFPEIHTNANVEETNTKMVPIDGPVTINDKVTYKNLIPGKEYTLSATLVVKNDKSGTYEDGDSLLDKDGKPITAEITFVPEDTDGEVVVPIIFDGYLMPEVEIVCFETLSNDKGLDIAVHNDIEDEDQTTGVVKVHTTVKTEGTDGQDTLATEETVIIDTVAYAKLVPSLTYKLKGTLMQKSTGKELLGKDGKPITAEIEFVPEESEGTVDMTFPAFDAVELALNGDSIVVFEKLYVEVTKEDAEGNEETTEVYIGHHEDIEDEGQTIYIPEIHTTASDSETGDHVGTVSEKTTIIDKVEYKNLIVGKKYTVKGVLMVKETGKPLMVNGKEVTAEKTFTTKTADGFVELEFTFDSSSLEGKTVVAFEDIYREDYHVGTHTDIEDEDQTIDFPKVKTKAEDAVTKENIGAAGEKTTIIDTVSYWNLIVGKEYTVKGVLMVQDTGETLLVDGQPVRAEKTFTAKTKDGTIDLEFTFDSSAFEGKTLIVFEDLYHNNIRVCGHTDITDEDQSEHHPGVKTTATDGKTGDHVGKAAKEVTIIDTVEYKNLLIGKKYTVKGKLMDKDTGKEFLVNGKAVTAEKTFTAEKANGTVELIFKFDGSALEGKAVVVFEDIFYKGIRVGTHTDINDEGQTVYYPSVKTHVEDTTKRVQPVENVTVVDDVMYSKLKVGERYQLLGVLVDKKTGKNIMVDGLPVRVTKLFTAEAEDGMITMEFHFDATGLEGDVTVFEYLSLVKDVDNKDLNYYLVAEHTDLNDTEQTFMISPIPKTGDNTPVGMILGLMILSGLALIVLIRRKKRA